MYRDGSARRFNENLTLHGDINSIPSTERMSQATWTTLMNHDTTIPSVLRSQYDDLKPIKPIKSTTAHSVLKIILAGVVLLLVVLLFKR